MKKPLLAIELETFENGEWAVGQIQYCNLEDKDEIIENICKERKYTRISRFFLANSNGIEIEWDK